MDGPDSGGSTVQIVRPVDRPASRPARSPSATPCRPAGAARRRRTPTGGAAARPRPACTDPSARAAASRRAPRRCPGRGRSAGGCDRARSCTPCPRRSRSRCSAVPMARLCSVSVPCGDGDRARGDVVVVPAGVVLRRPAQQPDVDVGVPVQADVVPLVVAERDVLRQRGGVGARWRRPGRAVPLVQVAAGQRVQGERGIGRDRQRPAVGTSAGIGVAGDPAGDVRGLRGSLGVAGAPSTSSLRIAHARTATG